MLKMDGYNDCIVGVVDLRVITELRCYKRDRRGIICTTDKKLV